jgi:hypothetical protein
MTLYDEIYDLFLVSVRDYKLDNLFASTPTAFNNYLEGFLIKSIPTFTNCTKDLEDRNDTTQTFNIALSTAEKVILSNIMVYEWMAKEIQDITQMNLSLNDTDFKRYAESQNLTAKSKHQSIIREIFTQQMTNYEIKEIPWTDWLGGNYGG